LFSEKHSGNEHTRKLLFCTATHSTALNIKLKLAAGVSHLYTQQPIRNSNRALYFSVTFLLCFLRMRGGDIQALQPFAEENTYLLHGAESFLRSLNVLSYSRNSPHFMKPEGS
jgi:hypothetical protein